MYVPVKIKFIVSFVIALAWFVLCFYLALDWISDLAEFIGYFLSIIVILLIALIPGFMNMFLAVAFLIDKRPKNKAITSCPNITVLVPALNEEKNIAQTVQSIAKQDYKGSIEIIVIDNGSTDNTLAILQALEINNLRIVVEEKKGKSFALNHGLQLSNNDFIVTVDADTYLLPTAITALVSRFLSAPSNTAAVAGSIYVKNSRLNFMTRIQEWDYFHSIAAIKRMQSLFQGTLVAQGAFSLYKKELIIAAGAWPHTVGEDIVLTWAFLERGYRIDFSEDAIAFTSVPTTYKEFFHQRKRWARGMIEAFLAHPKVLVKKKLITFLIYWDLLFPAIDSCYFFIFIPGLIIALFGYYFIAGPMTIAVLPLTIFFNLIYFQGQKKMFKKNNLKVRRNIKGFLGYILTFYLIMVPASVYGYLLEIINSKKLWGTK